MQLLSVFLFSLSANADSFTVGLAYGMKDIKVDYRSNILIALITSIGTFISMGLGTLTKKFVSGEVLSVIGCLVLIILGILMIINSLKNKKETNEEKELSYTDILVKPHKADKDESGYIDMKESVTLGLALSLNNFGLGIGASVSGINIYLTTILTFVLSILCISGGVIFGKKCLSRNLRQYADLISGLIIVFLGLYELFIWFMGIYKFENNNDLWDNEDYIDRLVFDCLNTSWFT